MKLLSVLTATNNHAGLSSPASGDPNKQQEDLYCSARAYNKFVPGC